MKIQKKSVNNEETKNDERNLFQGDKKQEHTNENIQGNWKGSITVHERKVRSKSNSNFEDMNSKGLIVQEPFTNKNTGMFKNPTISKTDVSLAIMQAESNNRMTDIIDLEGDATANAHSINHSEDTWKEVTRKSKHRVRIVGNNRESSLVKGVPKYVDLHVSRVDPTNTIDDMYKLLKVNFSEVKIESITPKQPSLYSSYKVAIYDSNFKKAMNPSVWPDGSCISRFFYKKQIIKKNP